MARHPSFQKLNYLSILFNPRPKFRLQEGCIRLSSQFSTGHLPKALLVIRGWG